MDYAALMCIIACDSIVFVPDKLRSTVRRRRDGRRAFAPAEHLDAQMINRQYNLLSALFAIEYFALSSYNPYMTYRYRISADVLSKNGGKPNDRQ